MLSFEATVGSEGQMDAFIELAEKMVLDLGAGKRPAIRTTINGVPYQTRVAVYGGRYFLGLRKDVVRAAGAQPGSKAKVTLELDDAPRDVAVPADFAEILDGRPEARAAFERLSFTNRKEYVRWIEDAKREETRQRRLEQSVTMLQEGVKTPG